MIPNKNVILLGILPQGTILASGEDKYYIYYKSDSNLYMYDSLKNIETNLFTLSVTLPVVPNNGILRISVIKRLRGILKLFVNKITRGRLKIYVNTFNRGRLLLTAIKQ